MNKVIIEGASRKLNAGRAFLDGAYYTVFKGQSQIQGTSNNINLDCVKVIIKRSNHLLNTSDETHRHAYVHIDDQVFTNDLNDEFPIPKGSCARCVVSASDNDAYGQVYHNTTLVAQSQGLTPTTYEHVFNKDATLIIDSSGYEKYEGTVYIVDTDYIHFTITVATLGDLKMPCDYIAVQNSWQSNINSKTIYQLGNIGDFTGGSRVRIYDSLSISTDNTLSPSGSTIITTSDGTPVNANDLIIPHENYYIVMRK